MLQNYKYKSKVFWFLFHKSNIDFLEAKGGEQTVFKHSPQVSMPNFKIQKLGNGKISG